MLRLSLRLAALVISVHLLIAPTIYSQDGLKYFLPEYVTYDPGIPSPADYFGFLPGKYHIEYEKLASYIRLLSDKSPRIKFEEYGRSYENRPLFLVTVSSPENIKNIQNIKSAHLKLCDQSASSSENTDDMPVVVWEGFSVHGNEASGVNSVPLLLYHLAAAQGEQIENTLSRMVILIDPLINPDGYTRFSTWVNTNRSQNPNSDPNDREHQEPWPGGRGNHYWFDSNRDWLLLQHPESRSRIVKYHEWMPNVLTDHHEMGSNSTFFFQPGVPERTNPITPHENFVLTGKIAQYHAKALDKIGSLYFTEEVYDDFYYGKGSSYPDINGCIGILFEQASVRGHVRETETGIMPFAFAIRNQFTTALSTIEAASNMRAELLNYQKNFFAGQLKEAEKSPVKGYVFGDENTKLFSSYFLDILNRHGIKVYELAKKLSINGNTFYPGSAFVVPAAQPSYSLIKTIFEKNTEFRDSVFYDISSWTFPSAFNLPYSELKSSDFGKGITGNAVTEFKPAANIFSSDNDALAYVFEWKDYFAPKILLKLLRAGITAKAAASPFKAVTAEGLKEFGYGSIVVPLGIQPEKSGVIKNIFSSVPASDGMNFYSVRTGINPEGIDLGSAGFRNVPMPKVMMFTGQGISSSDAGEIWHMLDQRMELNVSKVDVNSALPSLDAYSVLIMPGGTYSSLDSNETRQIKEWTRKGGTLISIGTAAQWLSRNKITGIQMITRAEMDKDTTSTRRPYANRRADRAALEIPGAIFKAEIDPTHPVAYGYTDPEMDIFVSGSISLKASKDPYSTPLRYKENPLVSGFASKRVINYFRNSACVATDKFGNGSIILMAESPNYRAFWYSTNRLLMNSILFGSFIN